MSALKRSMQDARKVTRLLRQPRPVTGEPRAATWSGGSDYIPSAWRSGQGKEAGNVPLLAGKCAAGKCTPARGGLVAVGQCLWSLGRRGHAEGPLTTAARASQVLPRRTRAG
jgi:hypothetical protein